MSMITPDLRELVSEDHEYRQLELALKDSLAAKLFCGFGLTEPTPDHSYFGHLRTRNSSDPDARFGIKGKEKIWMGFKRHVCVDMKQGFITKSSIRPANEPDHKGLEDVCPESGMVLGDKAYGIDAAKQLIRARGCPPGVIHKNNMKCKNKPLESWLTKLRMPDEGTFAALNNQARFRGLEKLNFQGLMQALAFNLRRLVRVTAIPIHLREVSS